MTPSEIFWLAALVVFGIAEAATAALVSVWFVIGSLAALIASIIGASLWIQIIVFLAVSALALLVTRPLAKKLTAPKRSFTNSDRFIGMTGIVTEDIDNIHATGAVKVSGVEWTARGTGNLGFKKGDVVCVTKIEGAKLYVEAAPTENEGE